MVWCRGFLSNLFSALSAQAEELDMTPEDLKLPALAPGDVKVEILVDIDRFPTLNTDQVVMRFRIGIETFLGRVNRELP